MNPHSPTHGRKHVLILIIGQLFEIHSLLDMMVHTYYPDNWKAEAGGLFKAGLPVLFRKDLPQNKTKGLVWRDED